MDTLYSWSLLIALVAGAVGGLLGTLVLVRRKVTSRLSEDSVGAKFISIRSAVGAIGFAGFSLALSVVVHWHWGHGPASAEPMNVASFVSAHRSFVVAGIILVFGLTMIAYAQKRQRDSRAT